MRGTPGLVLSLACLCSAAPALAQRDADGDDGPGRPDTEITVAARRLDAARENISPALGASVYTLGNDTVEGRPGGETGTIARILLQAPGISQDAPGQLRLRQSQGNLQFRINNVILPDALTDPADTLSARLAAKVELVTGALPAQYGLQAGGVVNVTTKDGVYLNGGQAEVYGGARATFQPAFELGGSTGTLNYFATGQYQRSHAGLPTADGSARPAHDRTNQGEGMIYLDRVIGAQDRVSLVLSAADERFELPGLPGDTVAMPLAATRRDAHRFALLSLLHADERFSLQAAGFASSSLAVLDTADPADVARLGYGSTARELVDSLGGQLELSWEPTEAHTLRGGGTVLSSLQRSGATRFAFPLAAQQGSGAVGLLAFPDTSRSRRAIVSLFAQDEWRLADWVTLNLGGRFDHVSGANGVDAFSPRANLVLVPAPETTLHLGYARYVLPAPLEGADEPLAALAGTTARLPRSPGNPVRPEFDAYYTIGAQQRLGAVTLGVEAYWRKARNLLDEVRLAGTYRTVAFNYAQGRQRGLELNATYADPRFSAWANLAVAGARGEQIVSNEGWFPAATLAYAAQHTVATTGAQVFTASGGVSYRWDELRLSGDGVVGSGAPRTVAAEALNGDHLPAYAAINLSAVWRVARIADHPLDVRLDLINALDARYALSDGTGLVSGIPAWGERRGLFIGIEQGF